MITDNKSIIQLVGFDSNWVCVIHDLLVYNFEEGFGLDVFPNLEMEIAAADWLKPVPFQVKEMKEVSSKKPVLVGVGAPKNKYYIYRDFSSYLKQSDYANLITKSSIISDSSRVGHGTLIDHQCIISAQTELGFGVTIKRGARIGHHNKIGDFVDLNPGVVTSGNVTIEAGCEIGTGALIRNNVTVGSNSFVGMGSVVTKDIPANSIAFGSPCKVVKKNELWSIPVGVDRLRSI